MLVLIKMRELTRMVDWADVAVIVEWSDDDVLIVGDAR